MRAVDIIIKKRDKGELTSDEIEFFVRRFLPMGIFPIIRLQRLRWLYAEWHDSF